ncbi:uncharacterized protein LOC107876822 isoform X1 [Capsicum annuum]|uniref:uncharacterized protein LOC107876822 isoform X1 n=1 Tax=Capsicum annuum TaxID=4072 RepID=UPI0007BEFD52|nr:uncharacterized protein LOC107876822 isoform X1 [Capsicum annuum]
MSDKLMPKTKMSILMGYSDIQKGYILFDLIDKVFFVHRDVSFREYIFPFKLNSMSSTQNLFTTSAPLDIYDNESELHFTLSALPSTSESELINNIPSVEVDPIEEEQSAENTIIPIQPAVVLTISRRSTRTTHPPRWMKDFVSIYNVPYTLSNYLDYDALHPNYQSFLASSSTNTEPTSYAEAIQDPRWIAAMQTEIEALETNQTHGRLLTYHQERHILFVSGYTKSSTRPQVK